MLWLAMWFGLVQGNLFRGDLANTLLGMSLSVNVVLLVLLVLDRRT